MAHTRAMAQGSYLKTPCREYPSKICRLFGTLNRLRHVCNKQINGRKLHPTVCRAANVQAKWGLPNPKRRKAIAAGLENSVW
ncbi:hypothetical protein GAY88_21795 [Phocaeicola vulgatus]|uniref:Uncharacterized protein n=2 Tax=Phocaeicola TaxID=909656 RepID=A0A6I0ZNZ3_PHOVU|nr:MULTISPECIES: hypothetical protein [Bacteroidaceae]KAB4033778.1 hypothetical protein GAQ73_04380 [Bacteroides uniformis]KAB6445656.1 hypothetical protein GAZ08_18140 [Phocaeicola vulgatus]KAA5305195.1 hypothetical protein F2Z07_26525 [Phocaeicola dorei]KAB6458294.1 hypothetical protein GAZ05_17115 [Phocaeicola vulgatus]KAB6466438.1 hypothetical protein GAZ07_20335 [Phocaeicola vulgatus]